MSGQKKQSKQRKSKIVRSLSLMETTVPYSPPPINGTITASTVFELCSNQEEAETRMFLHANHASQNGHQCIAIRSSDTDAEVLTCYHQAAIPADIVLISGTKSRTRIVSIRQVCEKLGQEICELLPSLHAITGCDSVSAFATKVKKEAFDIVQLYPSLSEANCW